MPERQPDVARVLHSHDGPPAAAPATVDVENLLAQLAESTAELTEAKVKREHAEAKLKTKTRELESERQAHRQTRGRLEADRRALETERDEFVAACRGLQPHAARQRDARAAAEAELKRAAERSATLQHQLQVVWAQLQQQKPDEPQRWWRRFGS